MPLPFAVPLYVQYPIRPDVSQARNLNQASRNPKGAGRWGPAPQPPAVAQVFWAYALPHNASRDPAIFKVGFWPIPDISHPCTCTGKRVQESRRPDDLTTRAAKYMHVMTHTNRNTKRCPSLSTKPLGPISDFSSEWHIST